MVGFQKYKNARYDGVASGCGAFRSVAVKI